MDSGYMFTSWSSLVGFVWCTVWLFSTFPCSVWTEFDGCKYICHMFCHVFCHMLCQMLCHTLCHMFCRMLTSRFKKWHMFVTFLYQMFLSHVFVTNYVTYFVTCLCHIHNDNFFRRRMQLSSFKKKKQQPSSCELLRDFFVWSTHLTIHKLG